MKRALVLIVFLFLSISLYAQKPLIMIIDENGNETKYNIEDISEIDFVKSNVLYSMVVYQKDTKNDFLVTNIKSLEFEDYYKLKINLALSTKIIDITAIDCIVFIANTYNQRTIGTQIWMCNNLNVDHYRNGDPIPEVTDPTEWSNLKTGAWCYYNNDPKIGAIYGKLYNWYAVNDPRGLAPEGWHVATTEEWTVLSNYLGGESKSGGKLKFAGTVNNGDGLWYSPNRGATNECRFSAIPGGNRGYKGIFEFIGYFGSWWAYSEFDASQAWIKRLYYDDASIASINIQKDFGFSVRCLNNFGIQLPKINSVSPDPVSMGDILTITGENFGSIQDTNFVSIYSKKIPENFYKSWSDTEILVKMPKGFAESKVSVTVNSLKSNDIIFHTVNINNPPKILSISPDTAMIGDVITIKGKNFGEVIDSGYVLLNDIKPNKNDYQTWNDSLINLKMPIEFIQGKISVTVYGTQSNNFDFATKPIEYSTVTDIDGNVYKTVKIGNQWWMAENLKVLHYNNGDSIIEVQNQYAWRKQITGAWSNYNNDPNNGTIYGKLYNWYAVNDPRGLTPDGWHIPRAEEWYILSNYVGGEKIAGAKLKSTGTIQNKDGLWSKPNTGATNASGFSAIPGGFRQADGSFAIIKISAYWWTSTKMSSSLALYLNLVNENIGFYPKQIEMTDGMSIRCVKDPEIAPYIVSIQPDSVMIGEILTINGKNFGTTQGSSFVSLNGKIPQQSDYISWNNNEIKVKVPKGTSSGKLIVCVNDIKSYDYYLTIIKVRYGTQIDIDGNIYKTMALENQVWFANNLNVTHYRNGDSIPYISDKNEWANLTTGAWCYYKNDQANGAIYGKLYNWYAVNDERGLAPEGWHIPNDDEWDVLIKIAGGISVTGGKLKEVGTTHWISPNKGATDEYGFLALPGGSRKYDGLYYDKSYLAYFWSKSFNNSNGSNYVMSYHSETIFKNQFDFKHGFSVRCVKD